MGNYGDHENSVLSFIRKGHDQENDLYVVCNFTPITRENYRFGVEQTGQLIEIFNSDATSYGGSGISNGTVTIDQESCNGRTNSAAITLSPLGVAVFKVKKSINQPYPLQNTTTN